MNELALFAGAGGGILGGKLLGWRTVCAVEIEPYPRSVLLQRQDDGILDPFPVWDDICTFDGKPWRGYIDVVSGGFPCQDISAAGKGAGLAGERSGLWTEMARVVSEVRPRYVFVENSPLLVSRGLDVVLSDLAALGYDASWGVVGAHHAGAPHRRDRIWILAVADAAIMQRNGCDDNARERALPKAISELGNCSGSPNVADSESITSRTGLCQTGTEQDGNQPGNCGCNVADTTNEGNGWGNGSMGAVEEGNGLARGSEEDGRGEWWATEPAVGRVANGVADRVHRLKAIGNGQVPAVAALAWRILGGPVDD